jgi:hypothetical protein
VRGWGGVGWRWSRGFVPVMERREDLAGKNSVVMSVSSIGCEGIELEGRCIVLNPELGESKNSTGRS